METGTTFGEYRIIRRIGAGGMAEVYLARHMNATLNDPPVVLRRILPALADNPGFIKLFLNEARIINDLNHRNIIRLLDFGKVDEDYFMLTDFIWGVSIKEIIDRCADQDIEIPQVFAARIVSDVCEGLHYAHNLKDREGGHPLNIIHLDINPGNIMVDFDGNTKLLDFGIAHATYEENHKAYNDMKGTYAYMSPEQCQEMAVDQRSDIFSLGVVLYELATRTRLFARHSNEYTIMKSITEGVIPPPSNLVKNFPRKLEDIILLALKVSPSERYQSAIQMKGALEGYIAEIEFDPEQEDLNAWLKRLFPDRYTEYEPYLRNNRNVSGMMPAFASDEEADVNTPANLTPPSGLYKIPSKDAPTPAPAPAATPAAGPEVRMESPVEKVPTRQRKFTPSPTAASGIQTIRKRQGSADEVEASRKSLEVVQMSMPDTLDDAGDLTGGQVKVKYLGHITLSIALAVLLVAALVGVHHTRSQKYDAMLNQGRLYVFTNHQELAQGQEPIPAILEDGTSLTLPIDGYFLPFGTHEITVEDHRFRAVTRAFELNSQHPVAAIYLELE